MTHSNACRATILLWISLLLSACSSRTSQNNRVDAGTDDITPSTQNDTSSQNPKTSDSMVSTDVDRDTGLAPISTETERIHDTHTESSDIPTDLSDSATFDTHQNDTASDTDLPDTETTSDSETVLNIHDTASDDTDSQNLDSSSDLVSPSGGCSSDLHSRTDRSGNIIETCPMDQGCLDGECVPACTAVAAATGNIGCDFLIPRPVFHPNFEFACFAVFIANNWNRSAKVTASMSQTTFDVGNIGRIPVVNQTEESWPMLPAEGVPEEQVAVLFLEGGKAQSLGCPVTPALDTNSRIMMTGRGNAWHITTDTPVSIYDILPYGGASSHLPSAGLVLPTSSWDTKYLAVVPPSNEPSFDLGNQWGQIVASEDNTTVNILPTTDLPSGTDVIAAPAGVTTSYLLNAGEILQWSQGESDAQMEMTGTAISASRPISFHGGNDYLCLKSSTSTGGGCDSAHQQIPPVNSWGDRYVIAPFASRLIDGGEESLKYRIVSAENDTTLTFDPPIPNAPTVIHQGEWQDFEAMDAFEITSQDSDHPFYIAQMMPGARVEPRDMSISELPGDEEFVNMVPSAQFMSSYVFFTDLTYATTTLTLTQCDDDGDFEDVYIRCQSDPVSRWNSIGTNKTCRWATFDIVREGQGNGNCLNGPQYAHSEKAFGLMVWGMDPFASYAYPAGALVTQINEIEIPVV